MKRTKDLFLVLLMLVFLAPAVVNAQTTATTTPDCKQFTYSEVFAKCVAEYVLPWVPISDVPGQPNAGYNGHLVFSNNTTGTVYIQDTQFINTAPDGTVQNQGAVVISVNGQSIDSQGISTTLSLGDTVSFDIVDTKCQYNSNLCTTPPAEMDLAVKVIIGGDPVLLSNLIPPTVNVVDTISGNLAWQYKYDATALSQATSAVSANVYVGGSTNCAVAVMNVSIGSSQEIAEVNAFLLDQQGYIFSQGTFGTLLADQNAAMDCTKLFPEITTLKAPVNLSLLIVTTALVNKLAAIVPQIEGGGGMEPNAHVTSSTVFPDIQGLKGPQ